MTTDEFREAKTLWKMYYAEHCFRRARETAEHIFKQKLENDNSLYYPLVTAVYVLYGKPFTNWAGVGSLEKSMVPKEHKDQHELLMTHRHKIYAHTDSNAFPVDTFGPPSQVRVKMIHDGRGLAAKLFATDFYARYPAMPPIIALCKVLEEKTAYHRQKLWDKHKGKIPHKVGEFSLNILDQNKDLWLKETPMMEHPKDRIRIPKS